MKRNELKFIVLQVIMFSFLGCSFASTKEKTIHPDIIIANDGVGEFKLDSDINQYNLLKYKAVSDTSALLSEDETEETKGKVVYFNESQHLVLWLKHNRIIEINLMTNGFSTRNGLKIGMNFDELFRKIIGSYEFDFEHNFSFSIPSRNILFVISNSNLFTSNEINNLYKHILSIKSSQLKKMKVEKIIIKRFDVRNKKDELEY